MTIARLFKGWALGCLLFTTTSCSSKKFTELFSHEKEPFKANNGQYFPDYIRNFFQKAPIFEKTAPSVTLAAESLKLIDTRPLNLKHNRMNEANLSWSSDGVYLGYEVSNQGSREILVKDLQGQYSKRLAKVPPKPKNSFYSKLSKSWKTTFNAGLRWSQDGKSFAFMSNGGTGQYNIYVGAIGEKEKKVISSNHKDGFAVWDPSEKALAFVSSRSGNGDIYHVDIGKSKSQRLSKDSKTQLFPEWLPSGKGLVYSSGSGNNHDLYILLKKNNGSWHKAQPLVTWKNDDLRPMVSPNGKWLAFYSEGERSAKGGKTWNLHVIPTNPKKVWKDQELKSTIVAQNVILDLTTGPCWAPSSNGLFYASVDAIALNPIYYVNLFNGQRIQLETKTKMNRDLAISNLGVLSFRAQYGAWDRVYLALTNQGKQLQKEPLSKSKVHYIRTANKPTTGETL